MNFWNYSRQTKNIYRLPHHKGRELQPAVAPSHTGRMQNAIDFRLEIGTPVFTALDGIVEETIDLFEDNGRLDRRLYCKANYVIIRHPWNEYSVYAHLKKRSIAVKPGQQVRQNQLIGLVGLSGFTSYPHLHFEVYTRTARYDDPTLLLRFKFRNSIFTLRSDNSHI